MKKKKTVLNANNNFLSTFKYSLLNQSYFYHYYFEKVTYPFSTYYEMNEHH